MALQFTDKVIRLARENGIALEPDDVAESLSIALQNLAEHVSRDPATRARLQCSFTVTMTSGIADLNTATVAASQSISSADVDTLLIGTIERIKHAGHAQPMSRVFNLSDLDIPLETDLVWRVYIGNNELHGAKFDTSAPDNGTVTFQSSFVPTLTGFPDEFIDQLIEEAMALVSPQQPTVS